MNGLLNNKVALITGAASGIGRASAQLFAQHGARVVVSDVNVAGGEQVAQSIRDNGGDAIFFRTDVGQMSDVRALVDTAVAHYGRIDTLFSNAGFTPSGNAVETSEEDWDRTLAIGLTGSGADQAIQISTAKLHFQLFDVDWSIPLDPIGFRFEQPQNPIARKTTLTTLTKQPVFAHELRLNLFNPPSEEHPGPRHTATLVLSVQLGERRTTEAAADKPQAAFKADITFPLVGDEGARRPKQESASLFHDLNLTIDADATNDFQVIYTAHAAQHGLQVQWSQFKARTELGAQRLYLFPGMPLAQTATSSETPSYAEAPGFAALTFSVVAHPSGIPSIKLESAFIEGLLTCQWGRYLADADATISAGDLFNAASGDIGFAYTARWDSQRSIWDETFLLNGYVEIINLISWPLSTEMTYDGAKSQLILPATRGASAPVALQHTRHAMRVLLNQHTIPSSLPVIGEENLLFNLSSAWQFLAVVKHQLIDVQAAAAGRGSRRRSAAQRQTTIAPSYALSNDRRWTTTQELRLMPPRTLKAFLQQTAGEDVTPPIFETITTKMAAVEDSFDDLNEGNGEFIIEITSPDPRQGLHWVGNMGERLGYCALRFSNVNVPRGARIIKASIELVAADDSSTLVHLTIYGEAAGNSVTYSGKNPPSKRPATRSSLKINLGKSDPWKRDKVQALGNLSGIVQEIIDRKDWNSGNSLSIIMRGDDNKDFIAKNPDARRYFIGIVRNAQNRARLRVAYAMPAKQLAKLGYYSDELRALLLADAASELSDSKLPKTLLVEASAAHWIQQRPLGPSTFTTLQYLPFGSQLAAPSNPSDFASADPDKPSWMLLTMPFLGRLQPLDASVSGSGALQVDPILNLETKRASEPAVVLPPLALSFASRADDNPLTMAVASFDTAVGHLFARLDSATLDECWMRLQHPMRERVPEGLQSVMAALPDTPARLSRSAALRQAFDASRVAFPPTAPQDDSALPAEVSDAALVWRKGSLLVIQGYSPDSPAAARKYAWPFGLWERAHSASHSTASASPA